MSNYLELLGLLTFLRNEPWSLSLFLFLPWLLSLLLSLLLLLSRLPLLSRLRLLLLSLLLDLFLYLLLLDLCLDESLEELLFIEDFQLNFKVYKRITLILMCNPFSHVLFYHNRSNGSYLKEISNSYKIKFLASNLLLCIH